jgi:hypothetical protein
MDINCSENVNEESGLIEVYLYAENLCVSTWLSRFVIFLIVGGHTANTDILGTSHANCIYKLY